MGFFQSYRSTEGLDRFPRDRQFFVWLAAHKRLKISDPIYRAQCRKCNLKMIDATVVFALIVLVPILLENFGIIPPDAFVRVHPSLYPASNVIDWNDLLFFCVFLPYIFFESFREQKRRNAAIADEIKKQPAIA